MSLRIFIFGEDSLTNNVLSNSLTNSGFDVIGINDNERASLEFIGRTKPDTVILNVDYGHTKAIEMAKVLRVKYPDMGLMVISKAEDLRLFGITKKHFPVGVLSSKIAKSSDLEHIKEKVEIAKTSTKSKFEFRKIPHLTDSQVETMRLMAEGMTNSEIAKLRFVSEKSVEQMLSRVATTFGIITDHGYNPRIQMLNTFYEMVNGRK